MALVGKSVSNNLDEQIKEKITQKKTMFLKQNQEIEKLTQELQI
jgi:hypothetical protein